MGGASGDSSDLSATQQKAKFNAESGLDAVKTMRGKLKASDNVRMESQLPTILQGEDSQIFEEAAKEAADVITRMRTGAAINEREEKFYRSKLPGPFDKPATVKKKLETLERLFSKFANPDAVSNNPNPQNSTREQETPSY